MGGRVAARRRVGRRRAQLRHPLLDDRHVQRLTDDAGGGYHHILRPAAQGLACRRADPLRVFLSHGGAGVGVAAVDNGSPGLSVRQMALVHMDVGGLHGVFRIHGGAGAVLVGHDQRHVLFPGRVGLDPHVDAPGPEALGGAHAAGDEVQHRIILSSTDKGHLSPAKIRARLSLISFLHFCLTAVQRSPQIPA